MNETDVQNRYMSFNYLKHINIYDNLSVIPLYQYDSLRHFESKRKDL